MDAEHWERVDELLQAALRLPAEQQDDFLRQQCGGDAELLEEVRSLLTSDRKAGSFLDPLVANLAARLPALGASLPGGISSETPILAGQMISHYRVLSRLGSGGMGVVYRAEDLKLGRAVALKFLPQQLSQNPQALSRFQREAKAASALNHPNICTIYEIDEADGKAFIAMELLEGQTIRQMLGGKALPTEQALEMGVQIADALDAAHSRGIIHRDVKSANIFVTTRGQAKVLDFGLAKFSAPRGSQTVSAPTVESEEHLTSPGSAVGTVAYMSPEQVRGQELDLRTDLFSFGAVLYEMTTGALPFRGDTTALIFHAILERAPVAPVRLNPDVPPELERIINKSLEKDRNLRYQHASDIRADLRRLKRDTESGHTAAKTGDMTRAMSPSKSSWRTKAALGLAGLLLICGSIAAVFYARQRAFRSAPVGQITHKQITFLGNAFDPAISPDGTYVVYVVREFGSQDRLMLKSLAGGTSLEIFRGADLRRPRWSPDGLEIAFILAAEAHGYVMIIPRLGGAPQKLEFAFYTCWSPDGSQLLAAVQNRNAPPDWFNKRTLQSKEIPVPEYEFLEDVDCSAATGMLALLTQTSNKEAIWVMKPDGSGQRKLLDGETGIGSLRWSATGDAVYFLRTKTDTDDLMRLSLTDNPARASLVTGGLQTGTFFTISADGARLAYARELEYSNLWWAELSARGSGGKATPHSLTSGTLQQSSVSFSPDQQWVALIIRAGGNQNLYKTLATGGQPIQLTFFENSDVSSPAWSPDGRRIAFICSQGGEAKVWIINADGTDAHPLQKTRASGTNRLVSWFPGAKIVYQKRGLHNFLLLNPDTEEESPLLASDLEGWVPFAPVISPVGNSVATWWNDRMRANGHIGVGVFSPPDPSGRFILFGESFPVGWSPDGRFVYATTGGDEREIVQVELANPKTPKTVATMPGQIYSATVSADGKKIIAAVYEVKSDVWIMDNFDPTSVQRPPR